MRAMLGAALLLAGALALVLPSEAAAKVGAGAPPGDPASTWSRTAPRAPIGAIAAGEDAVWAWVNTYELVRIDPQDLRITSRTDTRPALITDLALGERASARACSLIMSVEPERGSSAAARR